MTLYRDFTQQVQMPIKIAFHFVGDLFWNDNVTQKNLLFYSLKFFRVKHRLHEMISSRQAPDAEFLERLIPTGLGRLVLVLGLMV